jgi:hypothetical protein
MFRAESLFEVSEKLLGGGSSRPSVLPRTVRPLFDSALRLPPKAGCRRKVAQTRGELTVEGLIPPLAGEVRPKQTLARLGSVKKSSP